MNELEKYYMEQDFSKWYKKNLVEFMKFIQKNYKTDYLKLIMMYDSWLRGD